MPLNIQRAATEVFPDFIFAYLELKRRLPLGAEIQLRERESLNKSAR